jgi:hypothetical protein
MGHKYLQRQDVRQHADSATDSILCRYLGRAVEFDGYMYGYPDGTFFAVQVSAIPWPPEVEREALRLRIQVDALVEAKKLQRAVGESLVAQALVNAPALIQELTEDEVPEWHFSDRRDLERRHRIADARVQELTRLVVTEIKLRASGLSSPSLRLPTVADFLPPAPSPPAPAPIVVVAPEPAPFPASPAATTEPAGEDEVDDDQAPFSEGSAVVQQLREAVEGARQSELPQRLPGGIRRRLQRMPPGAYLFFRDQLEVRSDLCAALTDARSFARKNDETVVIDYDGEWPVVARRFGQGGRTIYRVEAALRRQGS